VILQGTAQGTSALSFEFLFLSFVFSPIHYFNFELKLYHFSPNARIIRIHSRASSALRTARGATGSRVYKVESYSRSGLGSEEEEVGEALASPGIDERVPLPAREVVCVCVCVSWAVRGGWI
jgi:hypothetical protein